MLVWKKLELRLPHPQAPPTFLARDIQKTLKQQLGNQLLLLLVMPEALPQSLHLSSCPKSISLMWVPTAGLYQFLS